MNKVITIALDAMGGDTGVPVVVPAALEYLREDQQVSLILVGDEQQIQQHLPTSGLPERLAIQHASQQVEMDDLPSHALRHKKDSSMRVAINLVKSGEADACVSAGNTGALMATSRFALKMLPAVSRPAIITSLPSFHGRTWVLDLGANIDCTADNLYEFAVMGAELVSAVEECESPTVGLLNIGQEEIKGIEQVKQADMLLSNSSLNYIGFVEGDDIYLRENLDIVVTDGFVGNVALKTSEGVAKMITSFLRREFKRNIFTRISALFAWPVLAGLKKRIDPRRYNGAALLGLRGIVVKSHGGADQLAFANAIAIAKKEVLADVAARIEAGVGRQLGRSTEA